MLGFDDKDYQFVTKSTTSEKLDVYWFELIKPKSENTGS